MEHKNATGGAAMPKQIGKPAKAQQAPGDATKNRSSMMSWTGRENKK